MFAVDIHSSAINHMPDRLIEKLSKAQAVECGACHPSPLHHLMFNYVKTAFRSSALRIDGSTVWQVELSGCISAQSAWFNSPGPLQHEIYHGQARSQGTHTASNWIVPAGALGQAFRAFFWRGSQVMKLSSAVLAIIDFPQHCHRGLARLFIMGKSACVVSFGDSGVKDSGVQFHHNELLMFIPPSPHTQENEPNSKAASPLFFFVGLFVCVFLCMR